MGLPVFEILLLVVIIGVPALMIYSVGAGRPSARRLKRFTEVEDLHLDARGRAELVAGLRRTHRGRVAGSVAGLVVGIAVGFVPGVSHPSLLWAEIVLLWVVAGGVVGTMTAQYRAPDDASPVRRAYLRARTPAGYRPETAGAVTATLIALIVAYGALITATAESHRTRVGLAVLGLLAAALGITALARYAVIRVVERAQTADGDILPVDEALRTITVRAVHHGLVAALLAAVSALGMVGVLSATFEGVTAGGEVVFRTPAGAELIDATAVPGSAPHDHVVIRWRDDRGDHVTRRPIPPGGVVDAGRLLGPRYPVVGGAGFWMAVVGFFGSVLAWIRSARFWVRRRGRSRSRREPAAPLARPA